MGFSHPCRICNTQYHQINYSEDQRHCQFHNPFVSCTICASLVQHTVLNSEFPVSRLASNQCWRDWSALVFNPYLEEEQMNLYLLQRYLCKSESNNSALRFLFPSCYPLNQLHIQHHDKGGKKYPNKKVHVTML